MTDTPSGSEAAAVVHEPKPATSSASPSFAPTDPTDGRKPYEYESRWPEDARKGQLHEGIYLVVLGILGTTGVFGLLFITDVAQNPDTPATIALVFFTGLIGGTIFDVKWWYHSIAKGLWHVDRRPWRIAVPWIAAVVAVFVHVLFKSDLLGILNPAALDKIHNVLAFGFLVGYFSDSAIAKLAEIAESLFGATRTGRGKGAP